MAKMTEETKARLRELGKTPKRILKHVKLVDLHIACDHWLDFGKPALPFKPWACMYLKYAKPEQVECLQNRLPHRVAVVRVPFNRYRILPESTTIFSGILYRRVIAFPIETIKHILEHLVDRPGAYMGLRWPDLSHWICPETGIYLPTEECGFVQPGRLS